MYREILEELNIIWESLDSTDKKFNLEDKFKKDSRTAEKNLDVKRIKEKIQQLKDGKASLEELENLVKEYKKDSEDSKKSPEKK